MECHECGATVAARAADCPHCGSSLGSAPDASGERGEAEESSDSGSEPASDGAAPDQSEEAGREAETESRQRADERDEESPAGQSPTEQSGQPGGEQRTTEGAGKASDQSTSEPGDGQSTSGQSTGGKPTGGQSEPADGGGQATERDGHAAQTGSAAGGVDVADLFSGLPLLPGAAAGFAVGVVMFGVAAAVAAVIPVFGGSTLEFGAVVLFDLHFATPSHVTPFVFEIFDVVRPPDATLGFLYLLGPILLYTAAKAVVAFNADEATTLPETPLAGTTVLLGYLPVAVLAAVVAPTSSAATVSPLVAVLTTGVVYPVVFGGLGGLAGGGLTGGERRVGTVYALGLVFCLVVGTFVTSFVVVQSGDVDLISRVVVSLFTVVGVNALGLGGGVSAAALPFIFGFGLFGAAGFLRAWRAAPLASPVRGFVKGITPAVTYAVVVGFLVSALLVLADDYVQETVGLGLVATAFVDGVVAAGLDTVGQYATAMVLATLVYPVVLGGGGGAIAAAIKNR